MAKSVCRQWSGGTAFFSPAGLSTDVGLIDAMFAEHNTLVVDHEAMERELREIDAAFGNPSALSSCETRADKITTMLRALNAAKTKP